MANKPKKIEIVGGSIYLCYEDENTNVSHETKILHKKQYVRKKPMVDKAWKLLSNEDYSFIVFDPITRYKEGQLVDTHYQDISIRLSGVDTIYHKFLSGNLMRKYHNQGLDPMSHWGYADVHDCDLLPIEKKLINEHLGDYKTYETYGL